MRTPTKKTSPKHKSVPVGRRGAKSRVSKEMRVEVPLKKIAVVSSKPPAALMRADEPREEPKATEPKIRDAEGRVLPGLVLSRANGAVLVKGTLVPHGGADRHNEDRSVTFLAQGDVV